MNVTVKLTAFLVVLLIGVVLGMQTAERGIAQVSGLPDQQPKSFYIKSVDKGKMEIAVMGKPVQTTNPESMVNYVSHMGLTLGGSIKSGAKTFVDWVASFFQP